jgi:hypothetical protein
LFIDLMFMSGPRPTSSAPWVQSLKALLIPDPPCEPRLACYKEMRDSGEFPDDVSLFLIAREIKYLVRRDGVLPLSSSRYEDMFRQHGEADLANAFARDPEAFLLQYEAGWRALYRSCSKCEEAAIPQSCVNDVAEMIMRCIRIPRGGFGPYVVARADGDKLVIFVYPPAGVKPNGDKEPAPLVIELDRLCGLFSPLDYMSWLTVPCRGMPPQVQVEGQINGQQVMLGLSRELYPGWVDSPEGGSPGESKEGGPSK